MLLALVMTVAPAMEVKATDKVTEPGAVYNPNDSNTDDTGTIRITDVTEGNTFKVYKIIDITYNSGDNTVSYEWATDVSQYVKDDNSNRVSVENFAKADEEIRQKLLSAIPAAIKSGALNDLQYGNTLTATGNDNEDSAETDAVVEMNNVAIGGYLVIPTSSTDVYQMMLSIIQPKVIDGVYKTVSQEIVAKKEPINIDKTVNDTTIGDIQKLTYTIVADVPTYDAGATYKTFAIGDKIDQELIIDMNTMKVYGVEDDDSETLLTTKTDYTQTTQNANLNNDVGAADKYKNQTFVLDFTYDNIKTYSKIKVIYDVTLKVDEDTAGEHNNNVILKYSHYPFTDGNVAYDEADVTIKSYKIEVTKTDDNTASPTKLTGAKFDVYLKVADDGNATSDTLTTLKIYGKNAGDIKINTDGFKSVPQLPNGSYIKVGSLIEDTGKSIYTIDGLAAGTYYLVETVAPNGYTLPSEAFEVIFSDATATDSDYIIEKTITNSSGFTLPETGGTGTVIFTVAGVSLMLVAVIAFFLLRKREVSKK